ncbi:hypothetical protein K493DRAFT_320877 [Basidiobolus meristosporus CBS 931.73]|uniref:Uncharacterized protein n=1 Tax=Basidiobolus meristosporus CBS 931.73 TaxID=1314790 RepID=A0A1Y1X489_9FUNG|nr:hypothetical protein K493DRAFT_320877 [Basidiobolus meristosporus CBS 931.73]|eukprot:ORX80458.1 hypothetical protein K493DRAFT_320877 [Basidiobolus meristosporus CBS 931.73]
MTSLRTYGVVSLLFITSYAFSLYSIFTNTWLWRRAPAPLKLSENYGLWRKCNPFGTCRPYPDADQGDCVDDAYCNKWHVAQAGMAVSGILGGMIIISLLGFLFANYARRSKGWKLVTLLLTTHAICQIISMSLIANISNNYFHVGTTYDISFVSCIVSWVLDIIIAVALGTIAVTSPPAYHPID